MELNVVTELRIGFGPFLSRDVWIWFRSVAKIVLELNKLGLAEILVHKFIIFILFLNFITYFKKRMLSNF